jgi:uridylate kinase
MGGPAFQRVLLKLSGEVLNGGREDCTIDGEVLQYLVEQIKVLCQAGVQVGIVLGGGNLFRGAQMSSLGVSRLNGDYMGMLGTIINGIALQDVLLAADQDAAVYTPFDLPAFSTRFHARTVSQALERGQVAVLAGGTGNPYCTTDSAAALRGAELGVDVILKATKVDGVYDKDPMAHPDAQRFDRLTFGEALARGLRVMDQGAIATCQESGIPIRVFRLEDSECFLRIAQGDGSVGTLIDTENRL